MPRKTQSQFKKLQHNLNESRKREMTLQKELELNAYQEHQRTVRMIKSNFDEILNNEKKERWKNRMTIKKEVLSLPKQENKKNIFLQHEQKNCLLAQKMYEKENEIIKQKQKSKEFGEEMLRRVNELTLHYKSLYATANRKNFKGQKDAVKGEIHYLGKSLYELKCKLIGKPSHNYYDDFIPKDDELFKLSGNGYYHCYEKRVKNNRLNNDNFNYENIM